MDANKINELRATMAQTGAEVSVAKNTLLKVALKQEKVTDETLIQSLQGPNATIFAYTDGIATLKALFDFAKKFELPKIKAGIVDGMVATAEKLLVLSNLPGRDRLLGQFVYTLKSPLTGFANVLGGSQRKMVYALKAIADKKGVA